jgi:hypothetical protein
MITKLQTLVANIKTVIDDISGDLTTLTNRVTDVESVNTTQTTDIDAIEAIPNIINVVYNAVVNTKVVTVTLDKPRVNLLPILIKDINTGNTQASNQTWSGNVCTITTTADVVTPFLVVVQ